MSDEVRYWHRLRVNGAVVDVAGEVTQQESLEQMDALSATCRVAGTPTVSEGQTADLYLVDLAAGTGVPQLSGSVSLRRTVGRPHEQYLILTGQLGRTTQIARRSADGDLLLGEPGNPASLTDGGAVQAILAYCGVAFTASDIQDAGHVLGDKKAVYWKVGVAAADLIADLDRVFQMRTVEVGAGRVVRFRYDAVPQLADAVATYERGVSAFFFNAERERGRFDEIRNVVDVTGATYDCGDDGSCSCQIAAHAEADNADLGAGVRTVPYPFSSELIQSTGVAEEVAKDLMRRLNRKVDRVACFGENDPNVTIGKVISVTDAAAGIDLSTATAFQVFAVQRTGNRMRLDCLGGAAGATGTVTSAIEQVCQDASFALPPDPSFSMPAISFPPVVGGVSIPNLPCEGDACGEENNPNACQDCACCATIAAKQARAACEAEFCAGGHESITVGLSDWVDDGFGEMHEGPAGLRFEDTGSGHYEGIDVEAGRSFRLRCAFEFLANPVQVQFVLRDTVTSPGYVLWAELYVYGDGMDPGGDTLDLWVGDTPQPAGAHAAGANPGNLDDCVLVWEYDHAAATMTATLSIDGIETQAVSDSTTGGTAQQDPMWVGLQALSDGSTGTTAIVEINSLTIEYT